MNNREFFKRTLLAFLFIIGGSYVYQSQLIDPLKFRLKTAATRAQTEKERLEKNSAELRDLQRKIQKEKESAPQQELASRLAKTLVEAPEVYFPVMIREVTGSSKVENPTFQLATVAPGRGTLAYREYQWSIGSTAPDALLPGELIASMENRWPLAQVTQFSLRPEGPNMLCDLRISILSPQ